MIEIFQAAFLFSKASVLLERPVPQFVSICIVAPLCTLINSCQCLKFSSINIPILMYVPHGQRVIQEIVLVVVVVGDTAGGLGSASLRGGTASQMLKGRCIVIQLFVTGF